MSGRRPTPGRRREEPRTRRPRQLQKERPMKDLCLGYAEEAKLDALPSGARQGLVDGALDYMDALRRSGHLIASNALEFVHTATTVRVENGKAVTTDGPFAETKEQLGGFILIEARDLDDAVQVVSKFPPLRLGCVEVRPVRELKHA